MIDIDFTEEMILNPDALPEQMRGMRRYRIEYGGHAEACVMECTIYLPRHVDYLDLLKVMGGRQYKEVTKP